MTRSLLLTAALVLSAPFSLLHGADAEGVTLKMQWQVGKRYWQTMKMHQSTSMNIAGQNMDQKMEMTMVMSMGVTASAEGGDAKRVAVKYEHASMAMDVNGNKTSFDSEKTNPGTAAGAQNPFAMLIGKEIDLQLTGDNKVKKVEHLDELLAGAGAANPLAGSLLNQDSLKQSIEKGALQALPEKPLKAGDQWKFSQPLPLGQMGKGAIDGTYTFKGMAQHGGAECAEIAVEGTIKLDLDGAAGNNPVAKMGIKLNGGTMKGTLWFDNALGTARGSEIQQEMVMEMNNPTQADEKLEIPLKQTVSTELTKVEDIK